MDDFQPQRILCAVDLSPASDAVAAWGGLLAHAYGARVTLLFADWPEMPRYFTREQIPELVHSDDLRRKPLQAQLQALADKHLPQGVAYDMKIVDGHAVQAIRTEARNINADLIIFGSHGHSGAARLLMGSVAENLVRETDLPLLIVKSPPPARKLRVLCPANLTEVARDCVLVSSSLAGKLAADLRVMYAAEEETAESDKSHAQLCSWLPEQSRRNCQLSEVVVAGHAAERIVQFAREKNIDLLVIGAQHQPFLEFTAFGQTTERVMRHSPASVLVVPRAASQRHSSRPIAATAVR